MSSRTIRVKRSTSFQFDALEDRSLLSAVITTAEIQPLKTTVLTQTVQGTVNGEFSAINHVATLKASGNLTVLKASTLTGQYKTAVKGLSLTISAGTATLSGTGGTINVKFTGSGKYSSHLNFTLKGTVTGGTGQFKGATGTFSATGIAPDSSSGLFQETITATVKTKV